jgi:hypothetical protein
MATKPPSITEQKVFAAAARDAQYHSERNAAEKKRSSKIDRLKALRLAKEATDAEAAKIAAAEKKAQAKAAPKTKRAKA